MVQDEDEDTFAKYNKDIWDEKVKPTMQKFDRMVGSKPVRKYASKWKARPAVLKGERLSPQETYKKQKKRYF